MTREEVESVLGPMDDALVANVLATGASVRQLAEAWAWLNNDESLISEGRRLPTGVVAELIELLSSEQPDQDKES